jgi:hypothetical protein
MFLCCCWTSGALQLEQGRGQATPARRPVAALSVQMKRPRRVPIVSRSNHNKINPVVALYMARRAAAAGGGPIVPHVMAMIA